MTKLKPFSRIWREGGSSFKDDKFMNVDGLGDGGGRERMGLVLRSFEGSKEMEILLEIDNEVHLVF